MYKVSLKYIVVLFLAVVGFTAAFHPTRASSLSILDTTRGTTSTSRLFSDKRGAPRITRDSEEEFFQPEVSLFSTLFSSLLP